MDNSGDLFALYCLSSFQDLPSHSIVAARHTGASASTSATHWPVAQKAVSRSSCDLLVKLEPPKYMMRRLIIKALPSKHPRKQPSKQPSKQPRKQPSKHATQQTTKAQTTQATNHIVASNRASIQASKHARNQDSDQASSQGSKTAAKQPRKQTSTRPHR